MSLQGVKMYRIYFQKILRKYNWSVKEMKAARREVLTEEVKGRKTDWVKWKTFVARTDGKNLSFLEIPETKKLKYLIFNSLRLLFYSCKEHKLQKNLKKAIKEAYKNKVNEILWTKIKTYWT